jgi:hypothetical protein
MSDSHATFQVCREKVSELWCRLGAFGALSRAAASFGAMGGGYKSLLCAIFGGQKRAPRPLLLGQTWVNSHCFRDYAGDTVWEMKQLSNDETDPKRYQMAIN